MFSDVTKEHLIAMLTIGLIMLCSLGLIISEAYIVTEQNRCEEVAVEMHGITIHKHINVKESYLDVPFLFLGLAAIIWLVGSVAVVIASYSEDNDLSILDVYLLREEEG